MKQITKAIENAKLEYISDIEWYFSYKDSNVSVFFYKDETGKNNIEECVINRKGVWIDILPTDKQLKKMWQMLDAVPYREEVNEIDDDPNEREKLTNPYNYYGVNRNSFY